MNKKQPTVYDNIQRLERRDRNWKVGIGILLLLQFIVLTGFIFVAFQSISRSSSKKLSTYSSNLSSLDQRINQISQTVGGSGFESSQNSPPLGELVSKNQKEIDLHQENIELTRKKVTNQKIVLDQVEKTGTSNKNKIQDINSKIAALDDQVNETVNQANEHARLFNSLGNIRQDVENSKQNVDANRKNLSQLKSTVTSNSTQIQDLKNELLTQAHFDDEIAKIITKLNSQSDSERKISELQKRLAEYQQNDPVARNDFKVVILCDLKNDLQSLWKGSNKLAGLRQIELELPNIECFALTKRTESENNEGPAIRFSRLTPEEMAQPNYPRNIPLSEINTTSEFLPNLKMMVPMGDREKFQNKNRPSYLTIYVLLQVGARKAVFDEQVLVNKLNDSGFVVENIEVNVFVFSPNSGQDVNQEAFRQEKGFWGSLAYIADFKQNNFSVSVRKVNREDRNSEARVLEWMVRDIIQKQGEKVR